MLNIYSKSRASRKIQLSIIVIFLFVVNSFNPHLTKSADINEILFEDEERKNLSDIEEQIQKPESSDLFPENMLYSGQLNSLNVQESAKLLRDETVILGNGVESGFSDENLSFYIDETHGWGVDKYNATITNLADKQNWAINSGFGNNENLTANKTVYSTIEDGYSPYNDLMSANPLSPLATVDGENSDYMRLHFVFCYTDIYDLVYLWNHI